MKPGPKPRVVSEKLLEEIEHHASRGLSQQQVCHAFGLSETWCMTLNRKIRIYRTVSKEVKQNALLRYQTQYTNRLWLGAQVQPAFFLKIENQFGGLMLSL